MEHQAGHWVPQREGQGSPLIGSMAWTILTLQLSYAPLQKGAAPLFHKVQDILGFEFKPF